MTQRTISVDLVIDTETEAEAFDCVNEILRIQTQETVKRLTVLSYSSIYATEYVRESDV